MPALTLKCSSALMAGVLGTAGGGSQMVADGAVRGGRSEWGRGVRGAAALLLLLPLVRVL
jgi:hypothetical protein